MANPELTRPKLARLTNTLSGVVQFIGLLVIVGWLLDIGFLKSVLQGAVTMKFNTAVGLFLAGLALFDAGDCRSLRRRRVGQVCSMIVLALGTLTLAEYVFVTDLGIDNLLFRESPGGAGTHFPGRLSPQTAMSFCLFGLAFLFSSNSIKWRRNLSQTLLSLTAVIALAALAGHLYGALYFYGLSQFTGMAVHTAFAFLALCAGLFCAQYENGQDSLFLSDTSGGLTARRLLPSAILVPLLLGWLSVRGQASGLYDTAAGVAILVVASMVVFAVLIGLTAQMLHSLDLSRRKVQEERDQTIKKLQGALDEVRTLQGLLPICAWCHKVREDDGYWSDITAYIAKHTNAYVSHGICQECEEAHFAESDKPAPEPSASNADH